MTENRTKNPIALRIVGGAKSQIKQPSGGVVDKQDPGHSESDFLSDLDKATRQKPAAS
jgi:hypothetical protein